MFKFKSLDKKKTHKKVAVVLLNLGAPDDVTSIQPFLYNFFCDKNIISLPMPFRAMLSWFISKRRGPKVAKEVYSHLGGKSPLLENTQAQADALQKILDKNKMHNEYKVFVSMRYWHPMSDEVTYKVKAYHPDEVILLPLYPQFSTTTSFSSITDWKKNAAKAKLEAPTSVIGCYPFDPGFIIASAERVKKAYNTAVKEGETNLRVLFSAHGLPEKVINGGDPYQWQCEETAKQIAAATGIKNLDWQICYQSRVGPLKWIGPSLDEALVKAAEDGCGILIYPHAFVSEHSETLVELAIEYRHEAENLGIDYYMPIKTVGDNDLFIKGLAKLVEDHLGDHQICAAGKKRLCPKKFTKCICVEQLDKREA